MLDIGHFPGFSRAISETDTLWSDARDWVEHPILLLDFLSYPIFDELRSFIEVSF
jgi:hypothetical protein